MNIKEILRYTAFNTKSSYPHPGSLRFTLYSVYNSYKITFSFDDHSILYININNTDNLKDKVTLVIRPSYPSVLHISGKEIIIPHENSTNDEWFNFSVQHCYTKTDFYPEISKIYSILKSAYDEKYMKYIWRKI